MNQFSLPHTWRLFSQIQNYAWGNRNQAAYIPQLLGISIEPDLPYAELWIGDNSKAPATVVPHGVRGYLVENPQTLDQLIASNPQEILGQSNYQRFGANLPFLAKVLSVGDSLSIQVHPNPAQAVELHSRDPLNYPDSNHKPEIAIAIDRSAALAGFRPASELRRVIQQYPEIRAMAGLYESSRVLEDFDHEENAFRAFFQKLCLRALDESSLLVEQVQKLEERLLDECLTRKLSVHEQLFLYLRRRYGADDPGLFLIFLLNHVELKPGDALLIPTGMPHAYLRGNIFECMACSDNVVRAGLTPKFRDLRTLVDITEIKLGLPWVHRPKSTLSHVEYPVFTPEFAVERVLLEENAGQHFYHPDSPYIIYFLEGEADLRYRSGSESIVEDYRHSHCVFVPAGFAPLEIRAKGDCLFFVCKVPECF